MIEMGRRKSRLFYNTVGMEEMGDKNGVWRWR